MCGRFILSACATALAKQFGLADLPVWTPHSNIAPTQEVLAVVKPLDTSERHAHLLRWGLISMWAEGLTMGSRIINARAETVVTKPASRRAFRGRRRIILKDGFYEWWRQRRWKQPFCICHRDGSPFAFARLWEQWKRDHRSWRSRIERGWEEARWKARRRSWNSR